MRCRRRFTRALSGALFFVELFAAGIASGQTSVAQAPLNPARNLTTGESLYHGGCAGCHGPHGEGLPDTTVGFDKPDTFPDFTDCRSTSREPDVDWLSIVHDGGRARGFSRIMPSFSELLTTQQLKAVVQYLRGLCRDAAWPRGELNLPRPLATEKAFPEDEAVVTVSVSRRRPADVTNVLTYERRIGPRNQIELSAPLDFVHGPDGGLSGGVGDIVFGFKRALYASLRTGSIFSLQGEVVTPTGNADRAPGAGTTVFEGFAAFGKLLPSDSFVQAQAGTEQPADTKDAARAVFGRVAIGKTWRQEGGRGRAWSPMVEVLADREFEEGAKTSVDVTPQVQVTLSRRQHVRANVGLQLPAANRTGRPAQVVFYVLWDWFDGGLVQGWK